MSLWIVAIISGVIVLYGILVRRDNKLEYNVENLKRLEGGKVDERVYYYFLYYPWQYHKIEEIKRYYKIGNVFYEEVKECFYEVKEIKGGFIYQNSILLREYRIYVAVKKLLGKTTILNTVVNIFEDKWINFDITVYREDINNIYTFIHNEYEKVDFDVDELLEELYYMESTGTISWFKLLRINEILEKYCLFDNDRNISTNFTEFIRKLIECLGKVGIVVKKSEENGSINIGEVNAKESILTMNIQQGRENYLQINSREEGIFYDKTLRVISEIKKYDGVFNEVYGSEADKVRKILEDLSVLVKHKKEPSKVKSLLLTLKDLSEGVAENLITSGIISLISNIL